MYVYISIYLLYIYIYIYIYIYLYINQKRISDYCFMLVNGKLFRCNTQP